MKAGASALPGEGREGAWGDGAARGRCGLGSLSRRLGRASASGLALPLPRRRRDVGLGERGGGGGRPRRALLAGRVPLRQHQRGGAVGGGQRPRQGRAVSERGGAAAARGSAGQASGRGPAGGLRARPGRSLPSGTWLWSPQESKKHLAGLGVLGLGNLITEITASEEESPEADGVHLDEEG